MFKRPIHFMRFGQIFLWGILFLLSACGGSRKAPAVTYTPDNIVPTDKSLLWRISGKGLKNPSYLYGTIHIIPKEDLQISEGTWNALRRCQKIAFEIDMKEMTNLRTQFSLLTKAFMKNGTTLKDLLPPEDYTYVQERMAEKGMAAGMFERLKPMFLTMILSNEEAPSLNGKSESKMTSVEMELWRVAKKQKLKSEGLETTAYQMSVFDSIPYKAQAEMLVEGLRNEQGGDEQLAQMIKMYQDQDIESMQKMISGDTDGMGEYEDVLLGKRNRNWIPIMGRLMNEQPTFFAVGAGHLGGKGGVIALLRAEGYVVEAVK